MENKPTIYAFVAPDRNGKMEICRIRGKRGDKIMLTTKLHKCLDMERTVKTKYSKFHLMSFVPDRVITDQEMIKADMEVLYK